MVVKKLVPFKSIAASIRRREIKAENQAAKAERLKVTRAVKAGTVTQLPRLPSTPTLMTKRPTVQGPIALPSNTSLITNRTAKPYPPNKAPLPFTAVAASIRKREIKAENKAAQAERLGSARAHKNLRPGIMPSSNVQGYGYDENTQKLRVVFVSGAEYEYSDISVQEWINISTGRATCKTDGVGTNGVRWWVGKNPSLGAAIWKYLRRTGKPYRKVT